MTLCGLKTRRFFKIRLKGIVKYPPRRSKQLLIREVLQLGLLFNYLCDPTSIKVGGGIRFVFYHYLFAQAGARAETRQIRGRSLTKHFLASMVVSTHSLILSCHGD